MSSSPGVAMETEGSEEGPKVAVVGSKESRTVFVSNLAMSITEEVLREKFSEVSENFCVKLRVHVYYLSTNTYMYIN